MTNKIFKENKKAILFLSVLILFVLTLAGCNWFGEGILNVIDPKAQIRVDYRLGMLEEDGAQHGIYFHIFSLNEVGFIGESFTFDFFIDGKRIVTVTRTIGSTFYVPPYPISSWEDPVRVPKEPPQNSTFPVYFQDVIDYLKLNPQVVEIDATITVSGTDEANHKITKTIAFDLPANLPGVDLVPPEAAIMATPTEGNAPLTVVFDASQSCDRRNQSSDCVPGGIVSYKWDFGDGTTSTKIVTTHEYEEAGTFIVTLTVTDLFGNEGFDTKVIEVSD